MATETDETTQEAPQPMSLGARVDLAKSEADDAMTQKGDTSVRRAALGEALEAEAEAEAGEDFELSAEAAPEPEPDVLSKLGEMSVEELEAVDAKLEEPPAEEEKKEEPEPEKAEILYTPEEQKFLDKYEQSSDEDWFDIKKIPAPSTEDVEAFQARVIDDPVQYHKELQLGMRQTYHSGLKAGVVEGRIWSDPGLRPVADIIKKILADNPKMMKEKDPIVAAIAKGKQEGKIIMAKPGDDKKTKEASDAEKKKKLDAEKKADDEKKARLISSIEKKRRAGIESVKKSKREEDGGFIDPRILQITNMTKERYMELEKANKKG